MAAIASPALFSQSALHPEELTSVTTLANLSSIPSSHTYTPEDGVAMDLSQTSIPVIDFSLLTSGTPEQRAKAVQEVGKACLEWSFFMVINHGIPEDLQKAIIDASAEFFNLTDAEKQEFQGPHALDPIKCGTSHNTKIDQVLFWRDFLRLIVHPKFHSPNKPAGFSEVALDYCERTRSVAKELLEAMSQSLGLGAHYIDKAMDLESGHQVLGVNFYPPCPQPEIAIGLPPHTDPALLTIVIQNEFSGLQLKHDGKWVVVNPVPNSLLVNTGDHLEILSNGKYPSSEHQAVVSKNKRITIAVSLGPSLQTVVTPAPEMINSNQPCAYNGITYKEYLELVYSKFKRPGMSTSLDLVRVTST